jgi:hypothetical protein
MLFLSQTLLRWLAILQLPLSILFFSLQRANSQITTSQGCQPYSTLTSSVNAAVQEALGMAEYGYEKMTLLSATTGNPSHKTQRRVWNTFVAYFTRYTIALAYMMPNPLGRILDPNAHTNAAKLICKSFI